MTARLVVRIPADPTWFTLTRAVLEALDAAGRTAEADCFLEQAARAQSYEAVLDLAGRLVDFEL